MSNPVYFKRIAEIMNKAHASGRDVPTIVLPCADTPTGELRLYRATARAKYPGDVQVTAGRDSDWYGAINHRSGRAFLRDAPVGVTALLCEFDADPAGIGGMLGLGIGSCVFCNRALTTDESKGAGYGPVCADRYGLPWGKSTAVADVAADYTTAIEGARAKAKTMIHQPGDSIPASPRRVMADRIVGSCLRPNFTYDEMVDSVEKILAGK